MMKRILIKILAYTALIGTILFCFCQINRLKEKNKILESNQEILLTEKEIIMAKSQAYRVSDSLNVAKATALSMTLAEFKKLRQDDLETIKRLELNKRDLERIIDTQAETILRLHTHARDTIIVDSLQRADTAKYFKYISKWTDVYGLVNLNTNDVDLQIRNRESLKIVETAEYRRFLGFLWRTNKIKSRKVDVMSENPATVIVNVQYTNIRK